MVNVDTSQARLRPRGAADQSLQHSEIRRPRSSAGAGNAGMRPRPGNLCLPLGRTSTCARPARPACTVGQTTVGRCGRRSCIPEKLRQLWVHIVPGLGAFDEDVCLGLEPARIIDAPLPSVRHRRRVSRTTSCFQRRAYAGGS